MNLTVVPYVSVGPIKFGMTPAEVRAAIDKPYRDFKRAPNVVYPSFYYKDDGVFVYFGDEDGCVEAVECTKQAQLILDGANLCRLQFRKLVQLLKTKDPTTTADKYEVQSLGLGVGATVAPDGGGIDAVIVFRRGYYDNLQAMIDAAVAEIPPRKKA